MSELIEKFGKYKCAYKVSSFVVAKYFLSKGESDGELLTNLKLQKLVYYAQGIHLAMYGKPIFLENIYAWNYGPVIPELYAEYKNNGSSGIPADESFKPETLDPKLQEFLDEIYTAFGQFSATGLMNLTHEDKCWKEAFPNKIIDLSAMANELKKYLRNGKE